MVYSDVAFIQRFLSVSYPLGVPSCIYKPNWTVQYEPHCKIKTLVFAFAKAKAQGNCFRYIDIAIPLLPKSEIASLLLATQLSLSDANLCLTEAADEADPWGSGYLFP